MNPGETWRSAGGTTIRLVGLDDEVVGWWAAIDQATGREVLIGPSAFSLCGYQRIESEAPTERAA